MKQVIFVCLISVLVSSCIVLDRSLLIRIKGDRVKSIYGTIENGEIFINKVTKLGKQDETN